jgi:hypothetical protein
MVSYAQMTKVFYNDFALNCLQSLLYISVLAAGVFSAPIAPSWETNRRGISARSAEPIELSVITNVPLTATCSGGNSGPYEPASVKSATFGDGDINRALAAARGPIYSNFPK